MFAKTFGCVRFIYNKMLGDKIAHYDKTKEKLKNTPAQYKAEFAFLKEADSLALANAQLNLQTAYDNFFRNPNTGFPRFKSRKNHHYSYTTNNQNESVRLENGCIKLPKIGLVKIKQHRAVPADYVLKSVTISKTPSGKYYASVLFEYEQNTKPAEIKDTIGLHFSAADLCTDSGGGEYQYNRHYRRGIEKIEKMTRALSKMKKCSKNWWKQYRKIVMMHEKTANRRKDFLHKLSKQITNAYDLVGVKDLKSSKSADHNSWGMFTSFLKYKLADKGKHLIKINSVFPSDTTCSECGFENNILLSVNEWICPHCGAHHHRSINAAVNIRNEAVRTAEA
jgi:putative transposase